MTLYPRFYWQSTALPYALFAAGLSCPAPSIRSYRWRFFSDSVSPEWRPFFPARPVTPQYELETDPFPALAPPLLEILSRETLPNKSAWIDAVEGALDAIFARRFEKVVLARRLALTCRAPPDPLALCLSLSGEIKFLFQPTPDTAFVGATPERLYRRTLRRVECDALAGTRPLAQAADLLASEKDRSEFLIVQNRLLEVLAPLCLAPPAVSATALRKTPTLCHLHSTVSGTLQPHVTDDDLLDALHPTPAVGGWPKETALPFIGASEPFSRGLYAAPIGYQCPDEAEYAVAIRSCLIDQNRLYLYAGTGIVAGSDPLSEWEETRQKLAPWDVFFQDLYANQL